MKTLEELQGITDVKIRSLLNKLHDAASKQEEELNKEWLLLLTRPAREASAIGPNQTLYGR